MDAPISIVVLISGSGSNLQAIIDAIAAGNINAHIAAVICNQANAYGLERAKTHGIATNIIDHNAFESREDFDAALCKTINTYQPDLVVLAGFMRILSEKFVRTFLGRMINIHPSLLPKYKGINTHKRALQDGAKEHGASVHFVTPELDGGPVIIQASVPVKNDDTAETLAARVLTQEHIIYPKVIDWFAKQRLVLKDGKIIFNGVQLEEPIKQHITGLVSLSPPDAFALLKTEPSAALIDIRSSMEFLFVGHPVGATHIAWIDEPDWEINPNFAKEVLATAEKKAPDNPLNTAIVLICRSGVRTIKAAKVLLDFGFTQVIQVAEGFEGDRDDKHQRSTVGGWRYHHLPWEQC